jgi:exonuclease SbcC
VVAATKESKNTLQEVNPQCAELEAQIEEINLDETWLPELIDGAETLESERRDKARLVTELNEGAGLYAENAKPFKTARRLRGFFGFLSWVLLPLVIFFWIIWAALKYSPETLMGLISSDFADLMSSFSQWANNWLLLTAILATLGFIISLFVKLTSSKKMRHLNMAANDFGKHLNNGYRHVTTDVETLLPERVVQLAQERSNKSQTLLILPPREQFSNIAQLVEATDGYQADSEEILAAVGRVDDVLKKQEVEIKNHSAILQADIDTEKERSDAAGELRAQLLRLNKVVSVCEHNIKVQDTSLKMLKRAAEDSIKAFNANIAKTSAKTLPKFTEGRYHKVKIDEDLKVQVFSDEKEGYMDFDEISSGTQRQIMLALRMAMSAELAKNTGNEKQFIFLDEPFAFFDQWRTKATLKALPDVSDVITQVWVVAQEFPDNADVKKIIECPLDEETLSV